MIRFQCPACLKVLKVPDKGAGRKIGCPKCRQRLEIPSPTPVQNKTLLGRLTPDPEPQLPCLPDADCIYFGCPGCSRSIPLQPNDLSLLIECARCGTSFIPNQPYQLANSPQQPIGHKPPEPSGFDEVSDRDEIDNPPEDQGQKNHTGSTGSKKVGLLLVLGVLLLGVLGSTVGALLLKNADRSGSASDYLRSLLGNEKGLVRAYISRNVDAAGSPEIAEWGEPRYVLIGRNRKAAIPFEKLKSDEIPSPTGIRGYERGVIMNVRWQEKNRAGVKVLKEGLFLVQGGKVTQDALVGEDEIFHGAPHHFAVEHALSSFDIAAERIQGTFTRVIIRGTLLNRGQPVTKVQWLTLNNENGMTESKLLGGDSLVKQGEKAWGEWYGRGGHSDIFAIHAAIDPPRYELSYVQPGRYDVTIEWEGKKTKRKCVVTDREEVQVINFTLDAD